MTVWLGVVLVMVGAFVSATVIVKCAVEVLPWASLAEQLICVAPNGNSTPESGAQETATEPSTTSTAVAAGYVTMAPARLVASAAMFAGTVMAGAVVSCTVILNTTDVALPC